MSSHSSCKLFVFFVKHVSCLVLSVSTLAFKECIVSLGASGTCSLHETDMLSYQAPIGCDCLLQHPLLSRTFCGADLRTHFIWPVIEQHERPFRLAISGLDMPCVVFLASSRLPQGWSLEPGNEQQTPSLDHVHPSDPSAYHILDGRLTARRTLAHSLLQSSK